MSLQICAEKPGKLKKKPKQDVALVFASFQTRQNLERIWRGQGGGQDLNLKEALTITTIQFWSQMTSYDLVEFR